MEPEIYGHVGRIHAYHYRSQGKFRQFLKGVGEVPGGTVSRFAAGRLVGVSRQRIHQIVTEGTVRCWEVFEGWPNPTNKTYSEIASLDLLEYAVRNGRDKVELEEMAQKYSDWSKPVREFFGLEGPDIGDDDLP